jgi:hypothetical protein
MNSARKIAVLTGVFLIVAAAAAVAGLVLYGVVLSDPHYIVTASAGDTRVRWGAFCEVILAVAVIGTAVTLFPVVKRQNEGIALGYVAGRVVEAVVIIAGIISLLSVVTLRRDFARDPGGNTAPLVTAGKTLVAMHGWTFLLGPGLAIGVNTLLLASLMYRSGLVPRLIAVIGLIGGPLVFASSAAVLFGLYQQVSVWGLIAAIPVFAWEMSLAVWLIVKGFKPSAIASLGARQAEETAASPAPAAVAG